MFYFWVSLAHLAGKTFRIGHMGNTTEAMLEEVVKLISDSLNELGYEVNTRLVFTRIKGRASSRRKVDDRRLCQN